jgi:hypothetical protein
VNQFLLREDKDEIVRQKGESVVLKTGPMSSLTHSFVASSPRREYSESKIKAYAVGSQVEQVNLDDGNLHILPPTVLIVSTRGGCFPHADALR